MRYERIKLELAVAGYNKFAGSTSEFSCYYLAENAGKHHGLFSVVVREFISFVYRYGYVGFPTSFTCVGFFLSMLLFNTVN